MTCFVNKGAAREEGRKDRNGAGSARSASRRADRAVLSEGRLNGRALGAATGEEILNSWIEAIMRPIQMPRMPSIAGLSWITAR